MRIGVLLSLFLFTNGYSAPCQDYTCDSITVKAILNGYGLDTIPVESVSYAQYGRINWLILIGGGNYQNIPIKISTIPDTIINLNSLQALWLTYNQFALFPNVLGKLPSLDRLYLEHNQITEMSDSISSLAGLSVFYIDNNQLTSLPEAIGYLASLERFHFNNNQITKLPNSISNLKYLENIVAGSLKINMGLELDSNRLCSLTSIVESWIDSNAVNTDWREVQDCSTTVGINQFETFTNFFTLSQNSPNPFKPTTSITYQLSTSSHVKLQVFNIKGKLISTIINSNQSQGNHTAVWDASKHSSGIYYFKLTSGDKVAVRKGLLQK